VLALLLLPLDAPSPPVHTVCTIDLATLTEQQARPLFGKRARFLVQLDSSEAEVDVYLDGPSLTGAVCNPSSGILPDPCPPLKD
jgi:hypothetical protein